MSHRDFYKVDLIAWVYGTIDRHSQGAAWRPAWIETYRAIGGASRSSGEKGCPMVAARTLYEYGDSRIADRRTGNASCPNCGTVHGTGRTRFSPPGCCVRIRGLSKSALWLEIQRAVKRELGEEPAVSNQGGPTLTFQLWHLGLIRQR